MVGIFGLGSKASPSRPSRTVTATPTPLQEHGPELPLFTADNAATTSRVITTTAQTATTHFFSMPLWKRRVSPVYGTTHSSARLSSDELGVLNGNASSSPAHWKRNKDLPPTPPHDSSGSSSPDVLDHAARERRDRGSQIHLNASHSNATQITASPSLSAAMRSTTSLAESSSSQSAMALARAALGIGLPPVMPSSTSTSSSISEVNTVTFGASSSSAADPQSSSSRMRRAKSFQRDQPMAREEAVAAAEVRESRRMRGLSLGPLQLSSENKGKQRESVDTSPAPKVVSRKSSFWSRKRNDSQSTNLSTTHTESGLPRQPSLPKLRSAHPHNHGDTSIPPPPLLPASSSSDLHRRHSERLPSNPPRPSLDISPGDASNVSRPSRLTRPRRAKRPQTADSAATQRRPSLAHDPPRSLRSTPPPLRPPIPQVEEPEPVSQPPVLAVHAPAAAPRPRSQTNPPLLHRISMNLFGGGASSPSSSLSAPNVSADSVSTSPVSSFGSPRPSLSKSTSEIPPPHPDEEMPEEYLERLTDAVNKAEIAAVLASHADAFHARALKAYIDHFEFWGDPLDVSLRKLLMNVGLPRETQQIDRVIEAFAARYRECNPTLFASDDHPYILAFSLIMLHTDAFNKSNKRKMTKADYVKNTRLPGVAPEVLDCFYDNIVFAPFIYIEDPLDVTGQRSLGTDSMAARRMSSFNPTSPGGHNGSTTTLLGKSNKIDPYYLITHNLLDDLRVNVRALVPPESPYVYQGTGGSWDEDELLRAFVTARSVEIALVESRYLSSPWFGLGVSSAPGPMFSNSIGMSMAVPTPAQAEPSMVKVTKVGLLMRKDDTLEGGRRGMNRRWREWSVLLTGSQLLFFRDPSWATSVQARINRSRGPGMIPHPAAIPQPDELLSVKDAIAVYDRSYTKHSNTLRLALADGRQFLLQAQGETEMNDWIARINYASAFKSAGVRMRSLGMSSKDIELTGIAAAASHLRDVHHRATLAASPRVKTWNGPSSEDINLDLDFPPVVETAPSSPVSSHLSKTYSQRRRESSVTTSATSASGPTTPPSETASRLFKATFDEVKTELAAGRWHSLDGASLRSFQRPRAYSLESSLNSPPLSPTFTSDDSETSRFSSRSQLIRAKLDDLESKISLVRTQLDSHMRFVRNLAVLTPFQRATRDRMQLAVQGVAKHIMQVRLELEKLSCYRDILVDDLAAEERDWQRTKKIAMRAATEKLAKVPRMTLSLYVDEPDAPVLAPSPRSIPGSSQASTSSSRAADPSVDGSFHSALSRSSTEWPDRHSTSAMMADPAHMFDSPMSSPLDGVHGSASSGGAYPFPDVSERPQASPLATQSSMESTSSKAEEDRAGHEKFYTAPEMPEEQAEEWNKTKAAKRVSLVRLPSDLRISVLFGKHHRRISEDTASAPSSPRSSMGVNPYDRTEATVDTVAMLDV